jgi:hypothetical protein
MTFDFQQLEREASEARACARKADEALEMARIQAREAQRAPLKSIVKRAHDCLCAWNHTDGCSWGYEEGCTDPWRGAAHSRWLTYYDHIINGDKYTKPRASLAEVEAVIGAMEALRPKVPNAMFLLRQGLTP